MSIRDKDTRRLPNPMLQEERLRRGWTQQEVANRVGTTVVNVSRWERGVTFPNPYFRQKLSLLFEKGAEELGLLPIKQIPQRETALAAEEVISDLPEKESVTTANELVTTANKIAPLPLRKRRFSERRAVVVAFISLALVIFVGGSGFLTHSFFFSQHKPITQSSSYQETSFTPTGLGKVIAQDTFHRPDQTFWGTASDRLKWEGDANTLKNFSIANNTAQVATASEQNYNATLGPRISNAEVLFSGSLSSFDDSNLGAVLRWQDTYHWYKAYIDYHALNIQEKTGEADPNIIQFIHFKTIPGTMYTIRFRAVGNTLMAKAWPKAGREPSNWMISVTNNSFKEGFCGIRIRARFGAIATVTSFVAQQAS